VPALARWKTLQDSAKLPAGTEILPGKGAQASRLFLPNDKATGSEKATGKMPVLPYKITSTGKLIDDALEAVEKENPKLKNVLNKNYTQLQIDPANLAGLINLIATIPFQHADLHAKDILGHVYEYFLGQFALAEGKKGGQYFTPKSIVSLIVEMIEPYQGRVYDPAMGSGGFFVQSERFIEEHGGSIGDIMVFGQDQWAWGAHLRRAQRARRVRLRRKQPNQSNPTTWRLAAMNVAIRGIDFDFGKEPADTFTRDQHPDLRADFVMANSTFNIKEWWDGKLERDARWKYGTPPKCSSNPPSYAR
jgi:type I restriction enzyme M protein